MIFRNMTVSKVWGLSARAPSLKDCGRLAVFKKDVYSYLQSIAGRFLNPEPEVFLEYRCIISESVKRHFCVSGLSLL